MKLTTPITACAVVAAMLGLDSPVGIAAAGAAAFLALVGVADRFEARYGYRWGTPEESLEDLPKVRDPFEKE